MVCMDCHEKSCAPANGKVFRRFLGPCKMSRIYLVVNDEYNVNDDANHNDPMMMIRGEGRRPVVSNLVSDDVSRRRGRDYTNPLGLNNNTLCFHTRFSQ